MKGMIVENEETTPEVEEVVETPETEEINEPTNDDNNEAVEEVTPAEAPAPDSGGTTEDEDDEEDVPYQPKQFQPEPIDFTKLPADENGNVDPNAFAQALQQRDAQLLAAANQQMQDQFMQMRQEERLWSKAEKAYPEISQNKELRQLVQQTRYGIIASGKNASPLEAAKQIFKHTQAAQQAGRTQAKESVRIQQSAGLETSSVQTNTKTGSGDLMNRIGSTDKRDAESARKNLYEKRILDGTIKI